MSNNLPYWVMARHKGGESILFIAVMNGVEVTQERYTLGNGTARRRVAAQWAKDDRLRNGLAPQAMDIERALEHAEHRVRESLDRGEGRTATGGTQATTLVQLVDQHAKLFYDPDVDEAFATIAIDGHHETYAIRSPMFKRWLSHHFYQSEGRTPNSQAMADALGVIEGIATHEGEHHTVHVRLAEHDGAVYIDLVPFPKRSFNIC